MKSIIITAIMTQFFGFIFAPLAFGASNFRAEGPTLTWSMTPEDSFTIGGETFSNNDYSFVLIPVNGNGDDFLLKFKFKAQRVPIADLYLYDSNGATIASEKIPPGVGEVSKTFSKKSLKMKGKGYKACLFSDETQPQNLICTPLFNDALIAEKPAVKVIINGKPQALRGKMKLAEDKFIEFNWVTETGLSFRNVGRTPRTRFSNISKLDDQNFSFKSEGTPTVGNESKVSVQAPFVAVKDPGTFTYTYELVSEP